ncbi:MAG: CPBP family intramembrane glutamic endopeptidase [Candidatus Binataceae bacterium]
MVATLAAIPGYFGLFGLGHLFAGKRRRAVGMFVLGLFTVFLDRVLITTNTLSPRESQLVVAGAMLAWLAQVGDAIGQSDVFLRPQLEALGLRRIPIGAISLVFIPSVLESLYARMSNQSKYFDDIIYTVSSWFILLVVATLIKERTNSLASLGRIRASLNTILWAGLGIFVIDGPLIRLSAALRALLRLKMWPISHFHGPAKSDLAIGLFCDVLTPAITEEFLFRGFLIDLLLSRDWTLLSSSLISMVCFALIHVPDQGPGAAVTIFVWSLVPTFLFISSGNLFSSMIVHGYTDWRVFLRFTGK